MLNKRVTARSNGRNYIDRLPLAHIVWNECNPNNPWKPGFNLVVHHKDRNSLNDDISNLELLSSSEHIKLHNTGKVLSEETCKKLSNSLKGKFLGEKHSFYGKHHSEESKCKTSVSMIGIKRGPMSDVHKNNISLAKKGKPGGMLGHHHNMETKKKISLANKGRIRSEEIKKKMSLARIAYLDSKK